MFRVFGRMWRRLNPEIVIGFLVATIFWIGILGWQAAYAPTEMEKQKCSEAAQKSGHKSEECKTIWEKTTSDPVAFFTLWLVIFTAGLTVSTVLLWRAGEKQLRHTRRSAAIQSRDMQASVAASIAAVEVAKQTYVAEHRTWLQVCPISGEIRFVDGKIGWTINIRAENVGKSPAHFVYLRCNVYRAQGFVAGDHERDALVNEAIGYAEAGLRGVILMPGEPVEMKYSAMAETSDRLEVRAREQIDHGVPASNLHFTLSGPFCVVYKTQASDEWRHTSGIFWITKEDKTEFLPEQGDVPADNLRFKLLPTAGGMT